MKTHELKTHPEPFKAMRDGVKYFEWRRDDRGFEIMDGLRLREWDPATRSYTGHEEFRVVTYIARGPAFGIPEGFCVLSVAALSNIDNDTETKTASGVPINTAPEIVARLLALQVRAEADGEAEDAAAISVALDLISHQHKRIGELEVALVHTVAGEPQ